MKLYCLVNRYLSGIRAGAQAAHSTAEILTKYYDDSPNGTKCVDQLAEWEQNHKTIAILNGGDHDALVELHNKLDGVLPCSYFAEPGLNNAYTSVSFLASTEMVEYMAQYRMRLITDIEMKDKFGVLSEVLMQVAIMRSAD